MCVMQCDGRLPVFFRISQLIINVTERHSVERIYVWQQSVDASKVQNHAPSISCILMPITCTWDFPDVIKFRVAVRTISEKAIRFRHSDYNPDRAQKLISSSMSRHLLTCNISSKSMHAFLSNLANRQTDGQTRAKTLASNFVRFF